MIPVYFCSVTTSDDLRSYMAILCEARWNQIEGIELFPIDEQYLGCSPLGFQRIRRMYADQHSENGVYIVADDDALLPADFDLTECTRIFLESEFSTLSLLPSNATINPWTPEKYIVEDTPDVMEHYSAGQVRFCLKGHLKAWPPMETGNPGYDAIHGAAIRSEGGRAGYFKNHKALHLGEKFSQIWNREGVTA